MEDLHHHLPCECYKKKTSSVKSWNTQESTLLHISKTSHPTPSEEWHSKPLKPGRFSWNFVSWAAYLRWARLVRLWGSWTVAASAGSFKGPLCLLLPRIAGEGWMGLLGGCDRMFLGCQGPLVSKLKVSTAAYDEPPAVPLITLLPGTPPRGGFILKRLLW